VRWISGQVPEMGGRDQGPPAGCSLSLGCPRCQLTRDSALWFDSAFVNGNDTCQAFRRHLPSDTRCLMTLSFLFPRSGCGACMTSRRINGPAGRSAYGVLMLAIMARRREASSALIPSHRRYLTCSSSPPVVRVAGVSSLPLYHINSPATVSLTIHGADGQQSLTTHLRDGATPRSLRVRPKESRDMESVPATDRPGERGGCFRTERNRLNFRAVLNARASEASTFDLAIPRRRTRHCPGIEISRWAAQRQSRPTLRRYRRLFGGGDSLPALNQARFVRLRFAATGRLPTACLCRGHQNSLL